MKILKTIICLFLLNITFITFCGPNKEGIDWFEDVDLAKKTAQEKNKPLIMYFRIAKVDFCKEMESNLFYDEDIIEQSRKYVWVWIDGEIDEETANYYVIHAYPEMIFYTSEGKELFREIGMVDKKELIKDLKLVDEGYCKYDDVKAKYEKDPDNLELKYEYASALYEMGELIRYIETLQSIKEDDANNTHGFYTKAELDIGFKYMTDGSVEKALECFHNIVENYPDSDEAPMALNYIGDCYRLLGEINKAIDTYKEVTDRYPTSDVREEAEKKVKQIEAFEKVVKEFWK